MGTITSLISTSALSGLALCVALWMMWRKKSKKVTSWVMLVAGLFLNGILASIVNSIVSTIKGAAGATVGSSVGLTASGVMVAAGVIVFLELWHGIHPKKGRPDSWHPWLALVAPALELAAWGVFGTVVHSRSLSAFSVTTSFISGLALCIALWMIWRKKSKKLTSWVMLVAGLFLSGLLANIVNSVVAMIKGTAGNTLSGVVGVSASTIMFILGALVCLELWHGIHPKKGRPDSWHPWLALVAPVLLLAAGGVFANVIHSVNTTATTVGVHAAGTIGG